MKRTLKDKFEGLSGRIVRSWKRNNGDRVLLSIQRYKGKTGADLRIWRRRKDEFRASMSGLRINPSELPSLFASIKRLKRLADDDEI